MILIYFIFFIASLSEDDTPVRSRKQLNSSGFSDFCIKDIRLKDFGRREIDFAEQGIT
jgi:adenosylhomocysteinase